MRACSVPLVLAGAGIRRDATVLDARLIDIAPTMRRCSASRRPATDSAAAGVYPHGDNAKQFVWMVRYGMTPLQAIQSATIHAAQALGTHGRDIGVLAVGKHADLIAIRGDPLANIQLLESVPFVMKGGVVVKDARTP